MEHAWEHLIGLVRSECRRQDELFGSGRTLTPATRYRIIQEECGEVAKLLELGEQGGPVHDPNHHALQCELVQVVACCVAWSEDLRSEGMDVYDVVVDIASGHFADAIGPDDHPDDLSLEMGVHLGVVAQAARSYQMHGGLVVALDWSIMRLGGYALAWVSALPQNQEA